MNYQTEIISIIQGVTDNRVLAFLYGLIAELVEHAANMEDVNP